MTMCIFLSYKVEFGTHITSFEKQEVFNEQTASFDK